ncbi:MAG: transcriptional repressor [Thermodesulfobacteriota bacterium]|nr:transcriptional repressor [Thermodesulfobacteriota bacterium]
MSNLHEREKEQFKKLFSNEGVDNFDEMLTVLEVFLQTEQHITASELVSLLSRQGHQIDPAFVRETLRLLCRFGFARKHRFDDGKIRYEHCHLDEHHDHMVCTKCNKIVEFRDDQLEQLQAEVAAANGFHMLQHKMEIYGICTDCLRERDMVIPLTRAKQGEHVVIESFTGGTKSHMRILSMGLKVGDPIELVTSDPRGQVVVSAGNKRYAIGRGLARKVMVTPYDG